MEKVATKMSKKLSRSNMKTDIKVLLNENNNTVSSADSVSEPRNEGRRHHEILEEGTDSNTIINDDETWSESLRETIGEMLQIMLSKESISVCLIAFIVSVASMAWSKFQRNTWTSYAYPGYLGWIILTRIGDAYLVYYPWKLCCPDICSVAAKKRFIIAVLAFVSTTALFFAAPKNKRLWETPESTTTVFKILVGLHFLSYFVGLFMIPYRYTMRKRTKDGRNSGGPRVTLSDKSRAAHAAGLIVLTYSFAAIYVPYVTGVSLFAAGPLIFIPVILTLMFDSSRTIFRHRGYCMLLSIFQLGIHALPSFMLNTVFPKAGMSSDLTQSLLTALKYYCLMAGYGHQWRLIAFNATTPLDHVVLLVLFQVFDVIFSNMLFIGVQEFNWLYFMLLFMTFCRVFIRESKILNDAFFIVFKKDGDASELAQLQCTRIRRARQNILLELLSSILLPSMFAIDSITDWDVIVRKADKFQSLWFLLQSAIVLFTARCVASLAAWMYLKYRARILLLRIPVKDRSIPEEEDVAKAEGTVMYHHDPLAYKYGMLLKENFVPHLQEYLHEHFTYVSICICYGIFNAFIFIGQINADLDERS